MKRIAAGLIVTLLALAPPGMAQQPLPAAQAGQYLLGPQDRVMVRVHSLRRSTGEAYRWDPLTGEFSVGADGALSLPIIGRLEAAGVTTVELAARIRAMLKETANLSEEPSAAVEVIGYRPFFIMGAVQQPGKYDFEPGLTVLQAVSVAQGFLRAIDIAGTERDIISARGELNERDAQVLMLEARLARFEAEADLAPTVPEALTARHDDPRVEAALRGEAQRFAANREALDTGLSALGESKRLLRAELVSLDEKTRTLERQLALFTEEHELNIGLRDRGLGTARGLISSENSQMSVQSVLLDVQVSRLRAQQSLADTERAEVDLRAGYRKAALDGAAETRAQLEQNRHRMQTVGQLLQAAMQRGQEAMVGGAGIVPGYRLVRQGPQGPVTAVVDPSTLLQPGDVLQVSLEPPAPVGQ
ncbi:polysaccharide biosynthesis/export family protein [Paenirhodobacter sp.]|uniref:polysaccharide biosynthesis/export family protein n=1 Tax=Paenirhodobacter sp. TaxID=1965326 RepID=UPI003B3CE563